MHGGYLILLKADLHSNGCLLCISLILIVVMLTMITGCGRLPDIKIGANRSERPGINTVSINPDIKMPSQATYHQSGALLVGALDRLFGRSKTHKPTEDDTRQLTTFMAEHGVAPGYDAGQGV